MIGGSHVPAAAAAAVQRLYCKTRDHGRRLAIPSGRQDRRVTNNHSSFVAVEIAFHRPFHLCRRAREIISSDISVGQPITGVRSRHLIQERDENALMKHAAHELYEGSSIYNNAENTAAAVSAQEHGRSTVHPTDLTASPCFCAPHSRRLASRATPPPPGCLPSSPTEAPWIPAPSAQRKHTSSIHQI